VVAALFGCGACALAGFVWATKQTSRFPPDLEEFTARLEARLEREREADRRHFAKALEEAASIDEAIKRRQQRADGARGGRPKDEASRTWEQMSPDEQRQEIIRRARLKAAS
jgi:hypothetical protein